MVSVATSMIVFESILSDVNYVAELIGRSNGSFYTILVPYPNPYMTAELVLSLPTEQ